MTVPRWILGTVVAQYPRVRLGLGPHIGGRDVHAVDSLDTVGMLAHAGNLSASNLGRAHMLDKHDGKLMTRAERAGPPGELQAALGATAAVDRVAHVHPSPAHGRHVGGQIITGHHHLSQAAPGGDEVEQAPATVGGRRAILIRIANAQQLQIVVLVEADGVVGSAPRVDCHQRRR